MYAAVFPLELLSLLWGVVVVEGGGGVGGGRLHIHLVKRGFQLRMEIFRLRENCLQEPLSRRTDMSLYLLARQGEINLKVSLVGVHVCVRAPSPSVSPRVCLYIYFHVFAYQRGICAALCVV